MSPSTAHKTVLRRGHNHGPPGIRTLSARLSGRLTPWQATVITLLWLYISRNFAKIVNLECPEPLANLYSRSYFRATWITTALDAGFWTAMKIKSKWLRDLASIIFSIYYLIAAEQADEKVRRVRATLTVDHLRVSWNKSTTPYLAALSKLVRPQFIKYSPRAIRIPRPRESPYRGPVDAWLYFDGPLSSLWNQTCVVLDIPGGGFVAMDPRTADDKLLAWAGDTRLPILSLDYKKAPEYPYPFALNECYDVYHTIVATRGRCLGLSGRNQPRIVLSGDSAGGNLAAGLTLMILQSGSTDTRRWHGEAVLPPPDGLVLVYPALDMNIGNWMTEEQMSLIQDRGMRKTNETVLRRKSEDYKRLTPTSSHHAKDMRDLSPVYDYLHRMSRNVDVSSNLALENLGSSDLATQASAAADSQPRQILTRLAVSSMISYFNDRILTPEMMRAMIILYIGPHNRPDFSTDFLLSPVLAPEALLARFPKTYFLTGERDPLVDDTVIFAGRIRQAKLHQFRERQDLGLEKSCVKFNEKDYVEVTLIPGISHGFLNFAGFFPDGRKHINRCARWIKELAEATVLVLSLANRNGENSVQDSRRSSLAESSADEDRPLEMSVGKLTPLRPSPDGSASSSKITRAMNGSTPILEAGGPSSAQSQSSGKSGRSYSDAKARSSPKGREKPRSLSLGLSLRANGAQTQTNGGTPNMTTPKREKSLTRLPSEEDLLRRRMEGLAGGLMGLGEGVRTP
jgi:acetyl esterase/lipase